MGWPGILGLIVSFTALAVGAGWWLSRRQRRLVKLPVASKTRTVLPGAVIPRSTQKAAETPEPGATPTPLPPPPQTPTPIPAKSSGSMLPATETFPSLAQAHAPKSTDVVTLQAQLAGVRAEVKTLNTLREQQAAELEKQTKALAEAKQRIATLQRDFDRLSLNNLKLADEHGKIAVSAESTTRVLKDREAEHAKHKEEVEALRKTKTETETELNELKHTLSMMNSDMDALRQGRQNAESKLQAREKELAETKVALEGERRRVLDFATEIQRLSAEAASFSTFMRDLSAGRTRSATATSSKNLETGEQRKLAEPKSEEVKPAVEQAPAQTEASTPPAPAETSSTTVATAQTTSEKTTEPHGDNLRAIPGLSRAFAKRLAAAGIQSYEALAATPSEKIHAICHPSGDRQPPDYKEWVAQASKLAAQKKQSPA